MIPIDALKPKGNSSTTVEYSVDAVEDGRNSCKVRCPRQNCGALLLMKSAAKLQTCPVLLEDHQGPFSPISSSEECWVVESPYSFENMGFSKEIPVNGVVVKYLSCAECDMGPLGWWQIGTKDYCLLCKRARYESSHV